LKFEEPPSRGFSFGPIFWQSLSIQRAMSLHDIARSYYSGGKKAKEQTALLVAEYGITPEHIQAKAVQIIGSGLQTIDRMIANRETSRRKLRKENERPLRGQRYRSRSGVGQASAAKNWWSPLTIMATEKQIAANRANARRAPPKTAARRLKSSRNALRHGLSLPFRLDMASSAKADAIARALASNSADEEQVDAATEVAQAQLELLRIRAVRTALMAEVDLASVDIKHLRRGGPGPLWKASRHQAPAGIP
jgi:hypothetical protein